MTIHIVFDDSLNENEVVIRCASLNEEVQRIQEAVAGIESRSKRFVCYQNDTEYYLPLDSILFFETGEGGIRAHTADQVYVSRYYYKPLKFKLEEKRKDYEK